MADKDLSYFEGCQDAADQLVRELDETLTDLYMNVTAITPDPGASEIQQADVKRYAETVLDIRRSIQVELDEIMRQMFRHYWDDVEGLDEDLRNMENVSAPAVAIQMLHELDGRMMTDDPTDVLQWVRKGLTQLAKIPTVDPKTQQPDVDNHQFNLVLRGVLK